MKVSPLQPSALARLQLNAWCGQQKLYVELTKNKMQGRIVLSNTTRKLLQDYLQEDRARLVAAYGAEDTGPLFLFESNQNAG